MQVCSLLCLTLLLSVSALAQGLATDQVRQQAFDHYHAGQEFMASEQWQEAADEFQQAITYEPLLTDAHYGLGQAFMGMRRYTSAIQAFGGCIEAARQLHHLRQKDRVASDRAIDDEIRELQDSMRRIGSGSIRAGQPQLRITRLETRISALERRRSSLGAVFEVPATVLLSLGSAHFRNGDRSSAEHYWRAAVKVDSTLGAAWNNLAVIYLGSGRKRQAEDAIRNAERAGFRVNPQLKDDIRAMP